MYRIAIQSTSHIKRIMAVLAAIIALSVFLYGIFLLEAVGNTAERTSAERSIRSLTSSVSSLEQAYLDNTRDLTLERAQALGFVAPAHVTTVFADAGAHALSLRTQ